MGNGDASPGMDSSGSERDTVDGFVNIVLYVLSVVVFVLCLCVMCVTCLLFCCTTVTGLKPNCSLTNIYIYIYIKFWGFLNERNFVTH
jgi:hypothetical protein